MSSPIISIIASLDEENGIGFGGVIPWYIPEDFKWFKAKTLTHVVIMGRTTFESIVKRLGKPLPERINIVVTRQKDFKYKGVMVADSIEKAMKVAKKKEKNGEIFIIGGGQIYNQTINLADRLYLTKVKGKYGADTFFPDFSDYKKIVYSKQESNAEHEFSYNIFEK
jgi:dihydrofolate reductase